jgi:two-component system sensor histidine kinase/response regulator
VRYQNARVLVVDDQPFNRDVVEGLLVAVGITPHLAENGRQAVDILIGGAEKFDLVLMDVQMPVMDGLTATRAIRAMEGFAQLPIIALTAHTMTHEKEKGVAAGMNDHIGKPFDEAGFYRALAKWIPLYKQCLQATVAVPAAAVSSLPSLRGVDVRAGLALMQGNEVRYRQWLGVFVTEMPATMAQLREALAAGQSEPAGMIVHTLKGRTGLMGMHGLHAIVVALEAAMDAAQSTRELLLDMERVVADLCAEIRSLPGKGDGP